MQLKMLVLVTVVVGVSAAASPAAALAAAPQPFTDFADVTGAATATLRGDVAPGGESTTIHFEYAPSADSFCVNGTGPRSSTTPEGIGAGAASILVSAAIGGLTPGQEYCFEVVAVNASAPSGERGGTVTFTSGAPDIFIDRVRSTAATALSVSGFVNPRAQSTNVVAEYAHSGTTFCDNNGTAGTHSTTGAVNVPAGTSEVAVSVPITSGLTAGQPYCARLVATAGGTRATSVSEITVGLPEVQSGDADGNGPTSEIIRATVWTSGQATTAHFEYGDASDPAPDSFCNSGGLTGAFTSTAGQSVPAGQVDAQVTATISGLTIGKDYCYRVAAQNASGTATDFPGFFTAGAPAVTTLPATGVTATGATFSANVNPEGLDTSVSVEWGTASGAWCASSGASGFSDGDRFADAGAGSAALDVVLPPAPLQPSTAYCYRAVAGNGRGTSAGAFLQLTTPAAPAGGGGGGGGGGGTGSGGTGAGGTGGAGGAANTIGTGATSNTFGPFDALGLPKLEYDPKFKQVSFSISSSAKGKLVAKLIFKKGSKKQVVGQLTKTLDGKAAAFVVPFNALGKRLFKKAKLAKLTLVVTITPTGKKAIVKQGTFTLKRGVGPCGGTRKASAAGGSAHMAC